jgi:hypothetical protein
MNRARRSGQRGAVFILSFMVLVTLTSVVASYLYTTSVATKSAGFGEVDDQSVWLSEAGLHKAIWNLMTTTGGGGQGEDWTTASTTENLGAGSYTMVVERWDWALAANGGTAAATSEEPGHEADKVIDGDDVTYWETVTKPLPPGYEHVTITFPYTLTVNKVRYYASDAQKSPKEYEWQVSTDGVSFTTVFSSATGGTDETNEFSPETNVNYLRLYVTKIGGGAKADGMKVHTVEALGSKITSTGTVGDISRKIEETIAVDDATTYAYEQIDWAEIAP